jgi:hypothetical protein
MKSSNRRSGWDIMRGANGAASHHYATLSIIAYAFLVAERGLFPQKTIEANLTSTHVQFSEIIDPTQPPVRVQRHNPTRLIFCGHGHRGRTWAGFCL